MSNGKVHDELSKDLEIPTPLISAGIVFYFTHDLIRSGIIAILVLVGITLQRLATPDLDIIENKKYKYGYYPLFMIYRDFGYIPYILWRWFWTPYALFLPHRSIFSHGFIIGTIIRLFYLIIPIGLLGYFLLTGLGYASNKEIWHLVATLWPYWVSVMWGFFVADCGHLLLDYFLFFRHFYEKILGSDYQWHQYHSTIDHV